MRKLEDRKYKQKTSLNSLKSVIKIHTNLGLVPSCFEQFSPGGELKTFELELGGGSSYQGFKVIGN